MGFELTRRELGKAALAGSAVAGLGGLAACGSTGNSGGEDRQEVMDQLRDFRVPRPVDFIRTNWSRDPLALCSYSYLAPGPAGSGIRAMLGEPVGRIVFTGEATAPIPATVHGAALAGRRTAATIADELPAGSRVAVVGAGVAGLACAGALIENGLDPVVIEASDRVGGRVRSGDLDGAPVDLGASWIHGVDGNPLAELAAEADVGLKPFAYDFDFPVPGQAEMAAGGEVRFNRAVDSFNPYAPGAREQTVDWLLPWRWGPGLEWVVQNEIVQEYGADPEELGALATWEGEWLGGGDALLEGPYVDLIKDLAAGSSIHLESRVRRIDRNRNGVVLYGDGEELAADAAVITVPIGVLKAGAIEFRPSLPVRTRAAITGLGAGLLDKVWLAFEEPFWDEEAEGFSWIDPKRPGRWGSWVNSVPVTGEPFLMTLSGGSEALRLAGASDLEVVSSAMVALEAMFG